MVLKIKKLLQPVLPGKSLVENISNVVPRMVVSGMSISKLKCLIVFLILLLTMFCNFSSDV